MTTYALTQQREETSWVQEIAKVVGASILIALFAPLSIPLPFTPIPLALQPHIVLLVGALLGSKRGSLAVLAYLLQGAMGLPVFAGATGGLLCFFGPRGGYLLGYVAAAFVTGLFFERKRKHSTGSAFAAMAVGNMSIYLFGAAWLSSFVGFSSALTLGVLPFLVGDFLKLVVNVRILKSWKFFKA